MNSEQFKSNIIYKIPNGVFFNMPSTFSTLMYITYYNVPEEDLSKYKFGAYLENNRFSFSVLGFNKENPEKISIEIRVCSAFVFRKSFRKKTATPEKIADYLVNFINKIKLEVPTSNSGK